MALSASQTTQAEDRPDFSSCEDSYLDNYEAGYKADIDVGRNLVDDGALQEDGPVEISNERACTEADALDLALNPPAPPPVEVAPVESTSYETGVGNSTVMCESGGDYSIDTGNGYYGGYQFDSGTWDAYGDSAYGEANEAPPAVQDAAAAAVPYDAWPNC